MAKFTEETFSNWTKPPSNTEESKLENAEKLVKEAITEDDKLKEMSIEIFGQGSYANNTNVRLNSDIDINAKYMNGFYFDLPEGKQREDFGLNSPSKYSFSDFKNDVEQALITKFGKDSVKRKNKCLTVLGNTSRVEADVVPTWNYRRYNTDGSYETGVQFRADTKQWVANFPKQHIENGKNKNKKTLRRFKRLTRLHRKLRYKMIEDGEVVNESITSFLIECLVWNVPNNIFTSHETWTDRLKESIIYLYENTKEQSTCNEWCEVSELLYLLRSSRKWSRENINSYLVQSWNYLEF